MKHNPTKYTFRVKEGKFLRHLFIEYGIHPSPTKVKYLQEMPSPIELKYM